jgi:predicted ATPase/class 3 adenylate cyclase
VDVAGWLLGLGLGQYEQAFRENDIDLEILPRLTAEDLIAIGVTSVGHRRKLLDAIATLSASPRPRPAIPIGELETEPPPVKGMDAERRQLTAMFVDLVGSTELSHRLGPEEMRQVVRVYQNAVVSEVKRFEGHVANLWGDGVLAYFGWPKAHEDEGERAVRAGLATVDAVSRAGMVLGKTLAARVGIATGLVVVGELFDQARAGEDAAVGSALALAARLQTLADPGSVVIAQSTRHLIGELFELSDLGAHRLKGFEEPVLAWRILGEGPTESRFEALHGTTLTPIIGREHEIELLMERFEQAKEGEGQVVLLSGEPGIGKSRMIGALRDRLGSEPYTPLSNFCSPFHVNSAFYPVIRLLEHAASFERGDLPEQRLDKLEALLAQAVENARDIAPLMAALLSIPTGDRYPSLNLTSDAQKQMTLDALMAQLMGLASHQPVLAVYEDVHWVDPSTLELLELVVERVQYLRILVIITFRPEFVPPWTGRAHVSFLTLGRLARRQGSSLIKALTGGKRLPNEVSDQLVAKTDGIPLFIEELTKTLLESGLLLEASDHYALSSPLPARAIPATLHDSLLARLDRLGPTKETAQIGAALGREFSYELLSAVSQLSESQLQDAIAQLIDAELIFGRGRPPHATYRFKHALVQDAAYASLLKGWRQQLHSRIAQVLEGHFPERAAAEPELLAHHYTEAGATGRAIDQWLKAGQRAAERSANVEAVAHLRLGLELLESLPDSVERERRELALQMALGMPLVAVEGYYGADTGAAYDRARELCERVGSAPQLLPILYGQIVVRMGRGDTRAVRRLAEEFLRSAKEQGADGPALAARRLFGIALFERGEPSASRDYFEQALAVYSPGKHKVLTFQYGAEPRSASLAWLALALWVLGYPAQAERAGREALALAKEINHAMTVAHALRVGGCYLGILGGDRGSAREHAMALKEHSKRHRMPYFRSEADFVLASTLVEPTSTQIAIAQLRQALAKGAVTVHRANGPFLLALLAEAEGRVGRAALGLDVLHEALALAEEMEERWWVAELHRLKGQLLLSLTAENAAAAEACYERAIDVAQGQGARSLELRAATSLARLRQAQGKIQVARERLAPIYAWFTEGFDTPDLKEAKALLEELS